MAQIDLTSVTETPQQASGTTFTLQLPASGTYAVGDVLMGFITNNGGGTTIAENSAFGWSVVAGQVNTTNVRTAVVYKKAASTSESNPVFNCASGTTSGLSWRIFDVDATTQIDASAIATAGSATSVTSSAPASATAYALAILCAGQNSSTNQLRFKSDDATAINANANQFTDAHQQVAFRQLGAAGAQSNITCYGAGSTNMQLWSIYIRNVSGGSLMPFSRSGLTELVWYGSHGSSAGAITNSAPSGFAGGASINSIATSAAAPTFATISSALDWGYYTGYASTENFATPAAKWVGNYHTFTFPDLSGKVVSFEWQSQQSTSATQLGADGHIVAFTDGTNIAAYQIAPKAAGAWIPGQWERYTFEPGVTTAYYTSAGAIDWTAATGILYATHSLAGSGASRECRVRNLCILDKATIIGGGANGYASWDSAYRALTSCGLYKIATKQGSAQYAFGCGVQVGDSTIKTAFRPTPQAFEMFPPYNSKTQRWWRVSADKFGYTEKASANDSIDLSASSMVTAQSATWTIDAASSTSAAHNFQSALAVGFAALLQPDIDYAGLTIKGTTIDLAAAGTYEFTVPQSTIINFTPTGASTYVMGDCQITGTLDLRNTTAHAITVELPTGTTTTTTNNTGGTITVSTPTITASISITGMPDVDPGVDTAPTRLQIINQTAAAAASRANSTAYSAGDVRLRQTGVGSENTAGLYLRCTTSGTSAGSPPTWNTTVGGTTTDGSAVWTTYAILYYDADPSATSLTDTYIDGEEFKEGETVEIRFAEEDPAVAFKTYSTSAIAATTGFSALVIEDDDSSYATYATSGVTQDSIFSPDYINNYVVLDTDTNFTASGAYAYYCYLLTTSEGMYRFWGGLTGIDPGNIRNNSSVVSLYFDCSSGFVRQTDDIRIFRSDGLRPALDPVTAAGGGIEINWKVPVNVVSTGGSALTPTESAQLMALPAAATNASAVRTELTTELTRVTKLAALSGIDATLVVTPTTRTAGSVIQTIDTVGDTTTVATV